MAPPARAVPDLKSFRRGGAGDATRGGLGGGRGGIEGEPVPLDSQDPKFSEYMAEVKRKIQSNWGFPCVRNAATKECEYRSAQLVIEFGILKDGRVQFVELKRSSTMGIYDDYALNAIKLSSPFPEIPRDIMQFLQARHKNTTGIPIEATFTYTVETTIRNLLR